MKVALNWKSETRPHKGASIIEELITLALSWSVAATLTNTANQLELHLTRGAIIVVARMLTHNWHSAAIKV